MGGRDGEVKHALKVQGSIVENTCIRENDLGAAPTGVNSEGSTACRATESVGGVIYYRVVICDVSNDCRVLVLTYDQLLKRQRSSVIVDILRDLY